MTDLTTRLRALGGACAEYAKATTVADEVLSQTYATTLTTASVGREYADACIAELLERLEKAIAHDRQPYPTADAYEKVCAARDGWQARAEQAEAALTQARSERNVTEAALEETRRDIRNYLDGMSEHYIKPIVLASIERILARHDAGGEG